jgi:TonB family protein
MIGRRLIPPNARLAAPAAVIRRPFSLLDERHLIPGNMQGGPLETRTAIPLHLPLGALAERVVVPRDMPPTPLDWASVHPDYPPLTILDQRVTVPAAMPAGTFEPKDVMALQDLPDVLPPDVITTGEINLLVEAVEDPRIHWNWVARAGSLLAHMILLFLIVFQAEVFPPPPQTEEQMDIARQQLSYLYLPPVQPVPVAPVPVPAPVPQPPQPQQQIRIDPRFIRELDSLDPSAIQPRLGPRGPQSGAEESASARTPAPVIPAPAPEPRTQPVPQPREPEPAESGELVAQGPGRGLLLPRSLSPGRALEESAQEALRGGGANMQQFGEMIPGGPRGGGGGQGFLGGGLEMLTPTEGIDFTSYLARIVASVKRNWLFVMPESARLGEQGRVVLQFRIFRDGLVPNSEPGLVGSSGKEPLDRAAISSIRASSPFPPLPPAFSGPFIELRFMFLYNLPPNYR